MDQVLNQVIFRTKSPYELDAVRQMLLSSDNE
jgi:hypothetical protein